MPPAPLVQRFEINRSFLWVLVGFGGLFAGVGVVLMVEGGFSLGRLAIALIGGLVAAMPYQLIAQRAAVELDARSFVVRLMPGGQELRMADVIKMTLNRMLQAVVFQIDDPTWGKRSGLSWRYPMLVRATLNGFMINSRLLADGKGFIAAMQAFGAAAAARQVERDTEAAEHEP
jgi:hypothetical protein